MPRWIYYIHLDTYHIIIGTKNDYKPRRLGSLYISKDIYYSFFYVTAFGIYLYFLLGMVEVFFTKTTRHVVL